MALAKFRCQAMCNVLLEEKILKEKKHNSDMLNYNSSNMQHHATSSNIANKRFQQQN